MTPVFDAITLLSQMDWATAMSMFWYMTLFEIPRYTIGFVFIVALYLLRGRERVEEGPIDVSKLKVSIVIAGHNEANAMRACIRSLDEQSRKADEIIVVDDGSTDGMREVLHQLRAEGLITMALCNQVRCGKSSACNLGMNMAKGDIVINLDADCSYDRDAIELLVAPFADPDVGATCGNIGVRNSDNSIVASYQAVEYLVSISLGKRVLDFLDVVTCASGAFGAFRREAMLQVGILSSGPGEDLELTMRMRRSGWKIRFVAQSWCLTDVPDKLIGLIKQRRRWDRDTFRIRTRKFRDTYNPIRRRFDWVETWEQCDYIIFNMITTITFPFYIGWLFYFYGSYAWTILIAVSIVYMFLDMLGFVLANIMSRRTTPSDTLALWPYALTFGMFNGYFMRFVRVYAYFEEFVFHKSYQDSYVPQRVLNIAVKESQ